MENTFTEELKTLLKRLSQHEMTNAEADSFLKKVDLLQLSSEEDMIRKGENIEEFSEKEKKCYKEAFRIVSSGFFRAQFFE